MKIPDRVKEMCYSATSKQLMAVHPDFHSGDLLHMSQGYMTHLTEEMVKLLAAIDQKSTESLAKRMKLEVATANEDATGIEKSEAYRAANIRHNQLMRDVKSWENDLDRLKNKQVSPAEIAEANRKLATAKKAVSEHCISSCFGLMNSKIKGLRDFAKIVTDYLKAKGTHSKYRGTSRYMYPALKQ